MRVHDSTTHSCDGVDAGAENNCDVTILIVLNAGNLKLNKPIRAWIEFHGWTDHLIIYLACFANLKLKGLGYFR